MAAKIELLHGRARSIEEQLTKLADSDVPAAKLAAILQDYRDACEKILSADFLYASANHVELQLWNAHLKVNSVFRKENRAFKKLKERVVERRKLQKEYLQFIKASQRFYRQYILNLDTQIEGIPELRKIAFKWKDDAPRTATRPRIDPSLKDHVLRSCHQTLIQLGDLSRYRESELGDEKNRNWGPAKGYYDLAGEIYPDSGHSHNQLAVVAREDGNHFRAVYHLYRSLASKSPYPQAKQNLELEFKRIVSAWEKGELIQKRNSADSNPGHALIAWFVRLHSKCYKGEDFKEHDELESEVLSHLAIEIKEHSLDSILQKIILINLAAEYFASVLISEDAPPNIMKTYFYFLRLNVKTFFTLLQVLQPELERLSEGLDVTQNGDRTPQLSDKITLVARRVLPGLRLYSTWFIRFWEVLNANIADTLTKVEVQELWRSYAETLTLLASSFPAQELPVDDYMLEEDTDTIGFQPLMGPETTKLWYNDHGMKEKWTDLERNHPNIEMLMRVRGLLVDGVLLTQKPDAPLDLDGARFVYREAGLPPLASPKNVHNTSPVLPIETIDFPLFPPTVPIAEDQKSHSVAAPSETASTVLAKDSAMNQMVDDLVGPDEGLEPLPEEDENIPPTPPEQTFEDTALVTDSAYGLTPLTISDLVNTVQNYKMVSGSPAPAAPLLSTPMHRGASSSSIRGPANLPSLPDGQWNMNSIWNRSYNGTPGPASPLLPETVDIRSSPLNGAHSGHVRGDSSNSLRSSDYSVLNTVRPPRPISGGLGSGTAWGNPAASHYGSVYGNGSAVYGHGPVYGNGYNQVGHPNDMNIASPLLFRGSYAEEERSLYRRTPPNGQAG
ncbi:hypothetical protein K458DRAFT_389592 [Lentithecium fluviatile CBS 122367]|uniref:DNA/RNA-binding domain-containing protein n=1 Tax=Lentithecium fluviatile CBS 122367 TaxID=1168545 RepID=A0A6G1J004_9PLEO|nr:hypothetical protein K458DRAFT_389592 [Lentithecium fluviatile CBS 122367]